MRRWDITAMYKMKKSFILMVMAISMMACGGGYNEPSWPGGNGGGTTPGGGGGTTSVNVRFEYKLVSPFTYEFTNKSTGATSYKWDFGDGETATTKNATHNYAGAGTYTVTLTGTYNGQKYDSRATITVKNPSIYIAGYKLYKIPYENKYYKVVCKDDDWFGTDWGFETVYTPLLDASDLPYVKYFASPKLMDKLDGDNYYTFQVFWSNNTTGSGTQCLKKQLHKTEILKYKEEHILKSDNGQTELGIIMEYR